MAMMSREEFDAEMIEWHRRYNEKIQALNMDMDRLDKSKSVTNAMIRDLEAENIRLVVALNGRTAIVNRRLDELDEQTARLAATLKMHGVAIDALFERGDSNG